MRVCKSELNEWDVDLLQSKADESLEWIIN